MEDIKYFIWFTMVLGVASESAWKFIKSYDTVYEAYYELAHGSGGLKLTDIQLKKLHETSLEKAEAVITYCNENDINIICYNSENYPEQFRNIKCPPFVLHYKGDISCISHGKNITCVGTRKPCAYTVNIISKICTELALNGFTIVSGFAIGSDIEAHISAIKVRRPTACVLGSGIDVCYPKKNNRYKEDVIKNGGVLISEFLPGTETYRCSFTKRNRLLAALSPVTIVFEAAEKSGSLNTAENSKKQDKTVLCVPPADIFDSRYAGNINLLRTFAKPLYNIQDIFDAYDMEHEVLFISSEEIPDIPENHHKIKEKSDSKVLSELSLTSVQKQILELLENDTLHIDIIIQKINMNIFDVTAEIMELQIFGLIKEMPGNRFARS